MPSSISTDVDANDTPLSRRFRTVTVGILALMSLVSFEALAVATAMPTVARQLGGIPLYPLAFSGAMAAGIACTVISGLWTDANGPKRPLWTGLALFVAGLLVSGTAVSMPVMIAGRVLQGFGSGLLSVALYVVVAETYPSRLRPKVFALLAAAWVVPSIVGPLLSGLLVDYVSWRWVFLLIAIVAIPAAAMLRKAAAHRDAADTGRSRRETIRVVGFAAAAGIATAAFQVGGQSSGPTAIALVVISAAAIVVCVPKLLPDGTFRAARGLPTLVLLRGLLGGAFACAEVFIPLLLTRVHGMSAVLVGFNVTTGAVAWSIGSWWQARPSMSWPRPRVIRTGCTSLSIGLVIVSALVLPWFPPPAGMVGWALCGLGMGMTYPVLTSQTMDLSAPGDQGRNSSALQLSDMIFMAVGVTVTGSVFALLLPTGGVLGYVICFAVAFAAAVTATSVAHRVTGRPQPSMT